MMRWMYRRYRSAKRLVAAVLVQRGIRRTTAAAVIWLGLLTAALVNLEKSLLPDKPKKLQLIDPPSDKALAAVMAVCTVLLIPWSVGFWWTSRPKGKWSIRDFLVTVLLFGTGGFAIYCVLTSRDGEDTWMSESGSYLACFYAVATFNCINIRLFAVALDSFHVKAGWHHERVLNHFTLCLVSALGFLSLFGGPHVERLHLEVPGLPKAAEGYSLCQLSDLHAGPIYGTDKLRYIAEGVSQLGCNAIVLNGDIAEGSVQLREHNMEAFANLASAAPDGAYYVPGNHEYYNYKGKKGQRGEAEAWTEYWQQHGFASLNNSHVELPLNGSKLITLAGVDDTLGAPDLKKALDGRHPDLPTVLVAHRPWPHADAAAESNVQLQLSGHTHGGQLWPIQALAAHSSGGYLSGLYRLSGGNFLLYVSDGLVGSYITRVRILSRAELTMAVLHTAPCEVCDKRDLLRQATFGLWLGRVAFMFGPCMLLLTMLGGCCRLWRGRSMCVKPGNGSSEPSPALAEMV